jgi:hypothetical protein
MGDRLGGISIFDIRVFPPLIAPCRIDLLDGLSFAEAFRKFVLLDAEVAVLAAEAVRQAPDWAAVFVEGRCHVHGFKEWPVAYSRWSTLGFIHPDPEKRSRFDVPRKPDPIEVVHAANALSHRYRILLSMLQTRKICAVGLNVASGSVEKILRPIWAHEEFHFDARTGDLLQDNTEGKDHLDRYKRRYTGIVIQKMPSDLPRHGQAPERSSPSFDMRSDDTLQSSHARTIATGGLVAGTKPPAGIKATAHRASIMAAIAALWPDGIPAGLTVKERDRQINERQAKNGQAVTSGRTIKRHLDRG